jgi:hypothetical protein
MFETSAAAGRLPWLWVVGTKCLAIRKQTRKKYKEIKKEIFKSDKKRRPKSIPNSQKKKQLPNTQ